MTASLPALAVDEVVDHARLERARPVERQDGDDVAEGLGLHALEQLPHAGRLDLEHADRVRALQQGERVRIVEREVVGYQVDAVLALHVLDGLGDDGERPQAQEVHLEQAHERDAWDRRTG